MAYNDGKPPQHTLYKWSYGPGGKSAPVRPGEGSFVMAKPESQRAVGVEAPVTRGNGLFKAKDCIPGKDGM
jgi:hypothetical protein